MNNISNSSVFKPAQYLNNFSLYDFAVTLFVCCLFHRIWQCCRGAKPRAKETILTKDDGQKLLEPARFSGPLGDYYLGLERLELSYIDEIGEILQENEQLVMKSKQETQNLIDRINENDEKLCNIKKLTFSSINTGTLGGDIKVQELLNLCYKLPVLKIISIEKFRRGHLSIDNIPSLEVLLVDDLRGRLRLKCLDNLRRIIVKKIKESIFNLNSIQQSKLETVEIQLIYKALLNFTNIHSCKKIIIKKIMYSKVDIVGGGENLKILLLGEKGLENASIFNRPILDIAGSYPNLKKFCIQSSYIDNSYVKIVFTDESLRIKNFLGLCKFKDGSGENTKDTRAILLKNFVECRPRAYLMLHAFNSGEGLFNTLPKEIINEIINWMLESNN